MYTRRELKKKWRENSKFPDDLDKFRKWLKEAYKQMANRSYKSINIIDDIILDCKQVPCAPKSIPQAEAQIAAILGNWTTEYSTTGSLPQKKETTMQTDTRTEAQQAKDYLISSLRNWKDKKEVEVAKTFHMHSGNGISSWGDLRKAVKEGWVFIPAEYDGKNDSDTLYDPAQFLLQVQHPDKRPDRKGYDAAVKAIGKAANDVQDQIVVFGPEKGLEALNAFKAQTFH